MRLNQWLVNPNLMLMLEINQLEKRYKKQIVLSNLSHQFEQGVTVITGKSGVGKTTLLRLCASAEKPSSGQILWFGKAINKSLKKYRLVLGYAPQQIDFPEDLSALDFMCHIGAFKNLSYSDCYNQTQQLLEKLDLIKDIHKPIQAYSGGMRRRLGLAQAFLGQPECLIIDEPSAELDPFNAEIVHNLIFEKAKNATVLMTTHLSDSLKNYQYRTLHLGNDLSNNSTDFSAPLLESEKR